MPKAPAEARRRAFHMTSVLLAPTALALPVPVASAGFAALITMALSAEAARYRWPAFEQALARMVGQVFRPRERVTGATLLALGYALTWWAFPGPDAARAIAVAAFADPAAAWAGRAFYRQAARKTWAGTGAALAVAGLVLLLSGAGTLPAAVAALAAALAERVPGPGLDNLAVPLATAAALFAFR